MQVQVESLASEVFTLTSKLSNVEGERDTALSKNLELEAAVGSATEERRGLLERCVSAEGETERSRGLTLELRRKLDDAQAALHELGRENQSIQVGNIQLMQEQLKMQSLYIVCDYPHKLPV